MQEDEEEDGGARWHEGGGPSTMGEGAGAATGAACGMASAGGAIKERAPLGVMRTGGAHGTGAVHKDLAAAEQLLRSRAHPETATMISPAATLASAASSTATATTVPSATVASTEIWLHWLQRHRPSATAALAQACVAVLELDGSSDRAFAELELLLPILHDATRSPWELPSALVLVSHFAPNRDTDPNSDSSSAHDNCPSELQEIAWRHRKSAPFDDLLEAATMALPLHRAFALTSGRVELRPRETRPWALLATGLQSMLGRLQEEDVGEALGLWWDGCADWWPEVCFEVHLAPRPGASQQGNTLAADATVDDLWQGRKRCAQLLVLALDALASAGLASTSLTYVCNVETRAELHPLLL